MRNLLIALLLTAGMAKAIIAMDDDARKRLAVGPRDAAGRNAWLGLVGIAVETLKGAEYTEGKV